MAPLSWRRRLVAALLLAAPLARAADVASAGPDVDAAAFVYPAPRAWTAALPQVAALTKLPGLDSARPQTLAPVTYELSHGLGLTEGAFARLSDADRAAAVELAVDQARQDLMQKSYELVGRSRTLGASKAGVTKAELDALYPLAAQLREIDRNYGSLLGARERQEVAASAARAAVAWRQARAAWLERYGRSAAEALRTGKEGAAESAGAAEAAAAPSARRPLAPSPAARKLLERMRATKSGWGEKDFETLYLGYGFTFRDGAKHRLYAHPDFPMLHTTVSRQRDLPPGYAQEAVKLIGELEALSAPAGLPAAAAAEDDELPPPLRHAAAAPVAVAPLATPL